MAKSRLPRKLKKAIKTRNRKFVRLLLSRDAIFWSKSAVASEYRPYTTITRPGKKSIFMVDADILSDTP